MLSPAGPGSRTGLRMSTYLTLCCCCTPSCLHDKDSRLECKDLDGRLRAVKLICFYVDNALCS